MRSVETMGALETLREERYAGWRGAEAEALDLGGGFSLERAAEEAARRWGGRENVGYFRDATLRSGRRSRSRRVLASCGGSCSPTTRSRRTRKRSH